MKLPSTDRVGATAGDKIAESQPLHGAFFEYTTGVDEDSAMNHWKNKFKDFRGQTFPVIHPSGKVHRHRRESHTHFVDNLARNSLVSPTAVIQTAWSILTSKLTASSEVVFGVLRHDRMAAASGVAAVTVPVGVAINWELTVADILEGLERQTKETLPFERVGLNLIRQASVEAEECCHFQTLLVMHDSANGAPAVVYNKPRGYPLEVEFKPQGSGLIIKSSFNPEALQSVEVRRVAHQLEHILRQLCNADNDTKVLRQVAAVGQNDLQSIWEWNSVVPEAVDRCVHDQISSSAHRQPTATAVHAWDGQLTYTQLDALSNQLARYLVRVGVKPGAIVPLCFEKSLWTSVAMLAVMKAGGASVAIDITQPEARLKTIVDQVKPVVILSSTKNKDLSYALGACEVVLVSGDDLAKLPSGPSTLELPTISSDSTLYIVFTSGSTGTPKGVIYTHKNFSSAIRYQQEPLRVTSSCRVFDFASYAFDIAWCNFIHTMVAGGCLCVPSEDDRKQNITGSMARLGVTYAHLTPTVARMVNVDEVPGLDTMCYSGEALHMADLPKERELKSLVNVYGPAETNIVTTESVDPCNITEPSIGKGAGANTWVVDPDNPDQLSVIGAVGELWLEGPLVGQGYLNDAERTAKAFVENPAWLMRGNGPRCSGREGRLYKTGDLVRYNPDGSLAFIGRKDTQVKIRGQRVELDEIELHVKNTLEHDDTVSQTQVVAEVITIPETCSQTLVAFVCMTTANAEPMDEQSCNQAVWRATVGIEERLASRVPIYMIPTAYVPMRAIPMTATGKTDRRRLRELGLELSQRQQLTTVGFTRESVLPVETEMERKLQQLWADVLSINADSISADDSFLRIGGDSIGVMKLVAAARRQSLSLSVADVFRHPRLRELAKQMERDDPVIQENIAPFSLLKAGTVESKVHADVAGLCRVSVHEVEDVLPCTPLQEGLLALTARRPGDYVAVVVLELQENVDLGLFRQSWQQVVAATPILRTRIVDLPGQGFVQAVLREQADFALIDNLDSYLGQNVGQYMGVGTRLCQLAIANGQDDGRRHFILTIHHALYDGWSLKLIFQAVQDLYMRAPMPSMIPFASMMKYMAGIDQESAMAYWKEEFLESGASQFPVLPSATYHPRSVSQLSLAIKDVEWAGSDFTASNLIRTAWSILVASYTGDADVVFGAVVTGRQASVSGIEHIVGPTIATVPVRVSVNRQAALGKILDSVQTKAVNMIPFEQTGLQRIRQASLEAEEACRFQTLLVVQPRGDDHDFGDGHLFQQHSSSANTDGEPGYNALLTYALVLECHLSTNGMSLHVGYDPHVLDDEHVRQIAKQFDHILHQVCLKESQAKNLGEISTISDEDLNQIWKWNADALQAVETPAHELFAKLALHQPGASAVCAWDGDLTYGQLDDLSTRLAHYLIERGIGPNTTVPLCFEKSMWTSVAMMAVMRTGATSVAVDVSQPEERLHTIIQQVSPTTILASEMNGGLAAKLGQDKCPIVVVSDKTMPLYPLRSHITFPHIEPASPLAIIFTSGSTGKPKGVILTYSNVATAMKHHTKAFHIGPDSRVYDFASYSFDFAWSNLLLPLSVGGCVCVPSEEQRKNGLGQSINDMAATFVFLTTSVARVLDPSRLQLLRTIAIGGEASQKADFERWPASLRLLHVYGPTECTVIATCGEIRVGQENTESIGWGVGTTTWVVQPTNNDYLSPVGAVGELWLEGPLVSPGYLNEPEKTALSFTKNVPWLLRGGPRCSGRRGHLYRTGDLVRYNPDGSIVFVGRKDTQVKIRGQRVELAEVEDTVRQTLIETSELARIQVVAEVITPKESSHATLVVFICEKNDGSQSRTIHNIDIQVTIEGHLAVKLPRYMIPTAYIPLETLPMTVTGKADRRKLREIGSSLTLEQITKSKSSERQNRLPETDTERWLHNAWATILGRDPSTIAIDDHFFHAGGDSIHSMRLVLSAREQGYDLKVVDIFRNPILADLARHCEELRMETRTSDPLPFVSLDVDDVDTFITTNISPLIQDHYAKISNILPVSDFQAACIDSALQPDYSGWFHFYLDFPESVDTERLRNSCLQLTKHFDILRTVFVRFDTGLLQVVLEGLNPSIDLYESRDVAIESLFQQVCLESMKHPAVLGTSFLRFIFLRGSDNSFRLVLQLSHAQYDGLSLPQIMAALTAFYNGQTLPKARSFSNYIAHVKFQSELEDSRNFWRTLLIGSKIAMLPTKRASATSRQETSSIRLERLMPALQPRNGATPATIFTASCAIMLSRIVGVNDVVFGRLVSGRASLPPGLQDLVGPCINTVPVRVRLSSQLTIDDAMLATLQQQIVDATPYDAISFHDIARYCTEWDEAARTFQVTTHFRNIDESPGAEIAGSTQNSGYFDRKDVPPDFRGIDIGAVPVHGGMNLVIVANSRYWDFEAVSQVQEVLCGILSLLPES